MGDFADAVKIELWRAKPGASVCGSLYRLGDCNEREQSDDEGTFEVLRAVTVCVRKDRGDRLKDTCVKFGARYF